MRLARMMAGLSRLVPVCVHQVGVEAAEVDGGDGADGALAGDSACQAVGGDTDAHASLDDGEQFFAFEVESGQARGRHGVSPVVCVHQAAMRGGRNESRGGAGSALRALSRRGD